MQILIIFWGMLFLLRTSGCVVRNIIGFVKDVAFEEKENRWAQSRNRVISRFFQGHHDAHLTVTCDV